MNENAETPEETIASLRKKVDELLIEQSILENEVSRLTCKTIFLPEDLGLRKIHRDTWYRPEGKSLIVPVLRRLGDTEWCVSFCKMQAGWDNEWLLVCSVMDIKDGTLIVPVRIRNIHDAEIILWSLGVIPEQKAKEVKISFTDEQIADILNEDLKKKNEGV